MAQALADPFEAPRLVTSCVTPTVLIHEGAAVGVAPNTDMFAGGQAAQLRGANRLQLTVQHNYRVVQRADGWEAPTAGYRTHC